MVPDQTPGKTKKITAPSAMTGFLLVDAVHHSHEGQVQLPRSLKWGMVSLVAGETLRVVENLMWHA